MSIEDELAFTRDQLATMVRFIEGVGERLNDLNTRNVSIDYPDHAQELKDLKHLIIAFVGATRQRQLWPDAIGY